MLKHPTLPTLAGLALLTVAAACVPIPVAAPPAKFALGGGLASGDVTDQNRGQNIDSPGALSVSAGLHPLQYFEEAEGIDAGVGFIFESFANDAIKADPLIGGYLELGYPLWISGPVKPTKAEPDPSAGRLYLIGRGELLQNASANGSDGFGVGVGLGLELVQWQDNPVASMDIEIDETGDPDFSAFVGYVLGEGGIGVELTANSRQVGPQDYNIILFRVIIRTPATLGVLLIPISDFMEDDNDTPRKSKK